MLRSMVMLVSLLAGMTSAAGIVTDVTARQIQPWKGSVEIAVGLSCESNDLSSLTLSFAATNSATKAAIPVEHITQNGDVAGGGTIWTRKFVWDAKADVGAIKIGDVALTVCVCQSDGVQLWENGPYWAECNVGATKPEEFGYYFWWGDTVGYKRNVNNDNWVSVKDDIPFSFESENCPTYVKSNPELLSAGYIDSEGELLATHDAASAHLGTSWRMPTGNEFNALINNCTTTWVTTNGVNGQLVKGKGVYASKSIFLPAAGYGSGSEICDFYGVKLSTDGYYWSSTPDSDNFTDARNLHFIKNEFKRIDSSRYYGRSVRPVQGVANLRVTSVGVTTHLALDCREGHVDSPIRFADCPYWGSCFEGQMKGVPYKQDDRELTRGEVAVKITKRGQLDSYQMTDGRFFVIPVTGVSAKTEIRPVFSWTTAKEDMIADCHVLTDEELRQLVSGGVSESTGWVKDEDDSDEVWLLQDFGTRTSHSREWPKGLWPNGVSDGDRYWIYVRINNLGYLDSELWSGDYTFRVGLGGTSEWTVPLHITFDASMVLSPSDMWRNVAFSGITSWSLKDHNQCRIGGLSFYGLGLFSGSFPFAAEVSVPSAGILYLYSGEGDDISDETLAVTSNTNISLDKTILFVEDGDGEMNSWYPIENFCAYSGCGSLRAIEIDGATTLSLKMKDTYQPKIDLMRVQFFPAGRKSAAVEASYGTAIPSPYREWDCDAYLQGKVTGTGVYSSGETVRLVATPGPGEAFDHWEVLLGAVPSGANLLSPTLEFVMTDDVAGTPEERKQIVVRAVWREKCAVTALPVEAGSAIIDGSGLCFNGETIEFKVKPAEGYEFVKWLDGSTENPRTVSAFSGGGERIYHAVVEKSDDGPRPKPDGGPYTETVNGVTWTYGVEYGEACVGYGWEHRAVEDTISGEVTIPSQLGGRTVTRISVGAFFKCSKVASVALPSCVRTLDEGCFEHCGELLSVLLPNGLVEIGNYAFHDCGKLQSVTIPDSVLKIGSCAFKGCGALKSITVSGLVANIGSLAFEDCGGLTSIVLGENVASIGENAFLKCDGLMTVMFGGAPPVGVLAASIKQDADIRYNIFYEEEWLPVIASGGWSNAKGYVPSQFVAVLNETNYCTSLDAAFQGLTSGENTIRLLGNTSSGWVKIEEGFRVTLDLNGFVLSADCEEGKSLFEVSGAMSVEDCRGGGCLVGKSYSNTSGGAFNINGALTLKSGVISNFNARVGGCAYVWQGGKLVIEDRVEISKCSSSEGGGGVYVRGELDFNGGLVSDCSSAKEGGGIKVEKTGVLNMAGGLVTGCTGVGAGGVFNRGVFLMTGGELSGNTATRSDYSEAVIAGNDLFMEYGDASVTINGGSVKSSIGYHSSYLDGYKAKTFLQGGLYGDKPLDDFVATGYAVKTVADHTLLDKGWRYTICVDEKTLSDLLVGCRDVASSGAAEWFTIQMDGEWVLQSGAISDNQSSVLTCSVEGTGILTFKWKSSSEVFKDTPIDYGEFKVDGVARVGRIGGDNDWMSQSITIDGGSSHTLIWAYTKDVGDFQGEDCIWLKDVVWTPSAVEPIPELGASADASAVQTALDGSADAKLAENITDASTYDAYREWALKIGATEVKASPNAWVSFATDSAALLTKMPTDDDLKVEEFKPSATVGSFDFTVSVKDVTIGDKASEDNLKKLFGLEGAESLVSAAFSSENVSLDFKEPQDGKLKFSATPAVDNAKSFFMKVKVK